MLDERRRGGCASCPATCPHYIALYGLSGTGGRVGATGLPEDYRYVTLKNSPARASQSKVYAMLDAYVATFERQFDTSADRIKSLYLYSESPGTGKTTSAAALINAWLVEHYLGSLRRNRQPSQQPAYFLDVNEWQTEYNNFNRPKVPDRIAEPAATRYYSAMERAKRAPFAVLDDIGVRSVVSDGFRGDLHAIINHRVTSAMPTIYTSNLPLIYAKEKIETFKPYDLIDVFGEKRLVDRMGDMCATLHFSGESRRGRR
ncbi:DNA replication protein [Bacillus sp. FJAT-49870]|uniref:DNA replication protein n=1 Tax=Lederbergia citri TaxID=2833580 RepID=A0A942TCY3_9BACI|nr:DNA replication protein [Lederbergia citri]